MGAIVMAILLAGGGKGLAGACLPDRGADSATGRGERSTRWEDAGAIGQIPREAPPSVWTWGRYRLILPTSSKY